MKRRIHSPARKTDKGVYTITLTPKMSRQFDAASEASGIPADWIIYDALQGEPEHYIDKATGYAKDSRPVWRANKRVPIKVVKGGAS